MTDSYGTLAWWSHDTDELFCLDCFPSVKDDYDESLMKINEEDYGKIFNNERWDCSACLKVIVVTDYLLENQNRG